MITHATHDQIVKVKKGAKEFTVSLYSNPTTGFQWTVAQYDKKRLTLVNSHYQKPQTQLIGVGGAMLFTFAVKKKENASSTKIQFKYARAWEAHSPVYKTVRVHFLAH